MTKTRPRVLLGDDHRMAAEGLKSLLLPNVGDDDVRPRLLGGRNQGATVLDHIHQFELLEKYDLG